MLNADFQEYLMQGKALMGNGNYEDAISYFLKAEKENNMDEDVYLHKGICYANLEKFEEAKQEFEKVLKITKNNGLALFHLGNIELLLGNKSRGIELYNNALANGFNDAQVYFSLGLMYEEEDNDELAVRNYSKAILQDPNRPDIRIRKIKLLVRNGLMEEAIQAIDEMILSNPDVFEGYHLKFLIYLNEKRFDLAEEVISLAMDLFPKDTAFAVDKAKLLVAQGKAKEAVEYLEQIKNEMETDAECLHSIAMEKAHAYTVLEDEANVVASLEEARNISSENNVEDYEESFLLMNCYIAQEKFDKTLEMAKYLSQVDRMEYYSLSAKFYIGFSLRRLGQEQEAIAAFEEAADYYRSITLKYPNNLDAYTFRIMVLRELSQNEKALDLSEYLIKVHADGPEGYLLKASVLESMGKIEEAKDVKKIAERLRAN